MTIEIICICNLCSKTLKDDEKCYILESVYNTTLNKKFDIVPDLLYCEGCKNKLTIDKTNQYMIILDHGTHIFTYCEYNVKCNSIEYQNLHMS